MTWRAKGHLEPPPRSAGGEEERVSERVKVRGGVGKAFEGTVDELDFNISMGSNPDVRPRKNRLRYERCYLVLVGGQVVTTGVVFFGTNGSHELKDSVRHIVRHGDALVPGGLDLSSVLVGHGTARLMELVDVGVVLEERILEHAENARAEDGCTVSASRKDFLASLERVITVNDVKLGKAGLIPGVGNEGAQLMGSGSVDA
jgi:hypothetical protein